jgi:BirA family transcriptional regulator, biotin operon repressor / biotin---[acetyl-CoA-carboxylase] ligase
MVKFKILPHSTIESTQATACSLRRPNVVVVAEEQTKGKGRGRRGWSSGKGGLYFSFSVRMENIEGASLLSLVAALAGQNGMRKICGVYVTLKWPNDIMLEGKKIGGILAESFSYEGGRLVVVGIGINTNNAIPARLKCKAASVEGVDNLLLMHAILENFSSLVERVRKGGGERLVTAYRKQCATIGQHVRVKVGDSVVAGMAVGVTSQGYLQVKRGNALSEISDGTLLT